ncbi:hypothetical protein KCU62_g7793, partial [Aureobasidium sp. EXF-3399]
MTSRSAKGTIRRPGQVTNMKYTYDIFQWNMYRGCYTVVFCDLDAEAFEQHSSTARRWLTQYYLTMDYVSPARRNCTLCFDISHGDPFMYPNALKYVFCAINRARHGKKMFIELPHNFSLSVQVHQVLIFLQVEECIAPMHGHIRQIIRERPLSPLEFDILWSCLGCSASKIHEFALSIYYERQKYGWSLALSTQCPGSGYKTVVYNAEGKLASKGETVHGEDAQTETQNTPKHISICPGPIGSDTEDEKIGQEEELDTTSQRPTTVNEGPVTIIDHPNTIMLSRRHSLPSPHSEPIYDIDASAFRECEDEEPEY